MEVAMKTSLMVLVVLLLVAGGALGVMNNACKTGHHVWCKTHVSGMPPRAAQADPETTAKITCVWCR
jgi:hypothetical protein